MSRRDFLCWMVALCVIGKAEEGLASEPEEGGCTYEEPSYIDDEFVCTA